MAERVSGQEMALVWALLVLASVSGWLLPYLIR